MDRPLKVAALGTLMDLHPRQIDQQFHHFLNPFFLKINPWSSLWTVMRRLT